MKPYYPLLGFLLAAPAAAASANVTTVVTLDQSHATPFVIWAAAIIVGLFLLLVSFGKFPHGEEALVSVMAWFPIGFAALTSFAVDRITSTAFTTDVYGNPVIVENHFIGQYPYIAAILVALLAAAIGNTWRIYQNQVREAYQQRR